MTDRTELPDGIYTDLSFETYLELDRVSSGDTTAMIEGPAAYWAQSSLNPDREEREETEAMKLGRAYHCARLEPEKFEELYVQELVPDELEGYLLKDADYKTWLKKAGLAQTKAGETVLDRAARVEEAGGPQTWHVSRAEWEQENADQTWLSPKHMAEIKRDAARIRMNPELERMISNGAPEVSILWTDPETGIRCKCRPDYLGPNWITHLKTWDSKAIGKPGNRSVRDAFMFNGYYRVGWFYLEGLMAIREQELVLRDHTGRPAKQAEVPGWIWQLSLDWKSVSSWTSWFLFLRRSGIPDIRAREVMYFALPKGVEEQAIGAEESLADFGRTITALGRKAELEVRSCLRQIAQCRELYGTKGEPWFPRDLVGKLEDEDFSGFWLDSLEEPR